jgi:hypothetical protein
MERCNYPRVTGEMGVVSAPGFGDYVRRRSVLEDS